MQLNFFELQQKTALELVKSTTVKWIARFQKSETIFPQENQQTVSLAISSFRRKIVLAYYECFIIFFPGYEMKNIAQILQTKNAIAHFNNFWL